MKKQEINSTSKTIDIEYTEQDIQALRKEGVPEDELPGVGVHQFGRSKFVAKRSEQKIKVSIYLDADVLDFFRSLADAPDAPPFQTQINNELRTVMNRRQTAQNDVVTLKMLENPQFLATLAEKLKRVA